jgi:peroxiredoxin
VELQSQYPVFQEAGAEVVALAVASVASVESWCQSAGVSYPMLADPAHRAAESYGVYNLLGDGLATPAVFVIDTDGRIAWSHVGQHANDRASVQMILEQLP